MNYCQNNTCICHLLNNNKDIYISKNIFHNNICNLHNKYQKIIRNAKKNTTNNTNNNTTNNTTNNATNSITNNATNNATNNNATNSITNNATNNATNNNDFFCDIIEYNCIKYKVRDATMIFFVDYLQNFFEIK